MRLFLENVVLTGSLAAAVLSASALSEQIHLKNTVASNEFSSVYAPAAGLESWIAQEREFALSAILNNIGPDGLNATGTAPGCILASPDKVKPNYFYQWVRDGAITVTALVQQWERRHSNGDGSDDDILDDLLKVFLNYIHMQGKIQRTDNPSGGFYNGGLGEPKFEVDGRPFTGSWGRPQRDSAALRATALVAFLDAANKTRSEILQNSDLINKLYTPTLPPHSVIKADLEYVSHSWFEFGFDAWEEVNGLHFFTAMVQLKAMKDGAAVAARFNDHGAKNWYDLHRGSLATFVQKFWDESKGHLVSTLDHSSRTGLNCDLMLGAIHGDMESYPPWSDEVLVSMEKLIKQMAKLHPVKQQSGVNTKRNVTPVGIGRYIEDIYDGVGFDGGNAWFICTSSVAQVIYSSITRFMSQQHLTVTERGMPFFQMVNPDIGETGELHAMGDVLFNETMAWMFEFADSFLDIVREHATPEGRMSEQFNTVTGKQHGAHDLTWSYGSFLTAVEARNKARELLYDA